MVTSPYVKILETDVKQYTTNQPPPPYISFDTFGILNVLKHKLFITFVDLRDVWFEYYDNVYKIFPLFP